MWRPGRAVCAIGPADASCAKKSFLLGWRLSERSNVPVSSTLRIVCLRLLSVLTVAGVTFALPIPRDDLPSGPFHQRCPSWIASVIPMLLRCWITSRLLPCPLSLQYGKVVPGDMRIGLVAHQILRVYTQGLRGGGDSIISNQGLPRP